VTVARGGHAEGLDLDAVARDLLAAADRPATRLSRCPSHPRHRLDDCPSCDALIEVAEFGSGPDDDEFADDRDWHYPRDWPA
jgi:hypothetical protein